MELRDRFGDLFTVVSKVNNVYPMELKVMAPCAEMAGWMGDGGRTEPTYQEIVERLDGIAMAATARGGKGSEATLMTWHRRLGHPSFKTVVELAQSGVGGMVITDVWSLRTYLQGFPVSMRVWLALRESRSTYLIRRDAGERASTWRAFISTLRDPCL